MPITHSGLRHLRQQCLRIAQQKMLQTKYSAFQEANTRFNAFEEAGDPFDPATAERLKRFVYSAGGLREPDEAYVAFRGRLPSVEPLLAKRGLVSAPAADA